MRAPGVIGIEAVALAALLALSLVLLGSLSKRLVYSRCFGGSMSATGTRIPPATGAHVDKNLDANMSSKYLLQPPLYSQISRTP
ncbi:hypothetical protein D9619_002477 [Psilocybe cf. subviscida]|uniref:Uncharacterized protein n=1 Tax=Psilocybe cf. subviscida TaxID=2480587 RepID=A0A8H5EU85_9AGAR|nr:hypothetical protein D9619_002477 [Psilocybe cf. subviscida]